MRMFRTGRVALLGLLLITATAACGGGEDVKAERDKAQEALATREGGVTAATRAPAAAGGASTAPAGAAGSVGGTPGGIAVELKEMTLVPSAPKAAAGSVAFAARNTGVLPHELVVLKTDIAFDQLPQRAGVVDEAAAGIQKNGDTEEFPGGQSKSISPNLQAGKYVLVCNVVGHYAAGMRAAFTVE